MNICVKRKVNNKVFRGDEGTQRVIEISIKRE